MRRIGRPRYRATELPMPYSLEKRAIYVSAVADALERFIDKRYGGIASFERGALDNKLVSVSPDAFAYVIMMVLCTVHGRRKVHFKLETDEHRLLLKITASEVLSEDPCQEFDFIRAAHEAGLDVDCDSDGYLLYADITRPVIFKVYAISDDEMYAALLRMSESLYTENRE